MNLVSPVAVESKRAVLRAHNLIKRYGGGNLPSYARLDVYSLAYWCGFSLTPLKPPHLGVSIEVHKSRDGSRKSIKYNTSSPLIESHILYAIGLDELGYLPYNGTIKQYVWGGVIDPQQMNAAIEFSNTLTNHYNFESEVSTV